MAKKQVKQAKSQASQPAKTQQQLQREEQLKREQAQREQDQAREKARQQAVQKENQATRQNNQQQAKAKQQAQQQAKAQQPAKQPKPGKQGRTAGSTVPPTGQPGGSPTVQSNIPGAPARPQPLPVFNPDGSLNIQNVMQNYNQSYQHANDVNEARYADIVGGHNQRIKEAMDMQGKQSQDLQNQYRQNYQTQMNAANANVNDYRQRADDAMNAMRQNYDTSMGTANQTVADSRQRGTDLMAQQAQQYGELRDTYQRNYQTAMGDADKSVAGYQTRYDDAMKMAEGLGNQEKSDLRSDWQARQDANDQQLRRSGLAGTTVMPTMAMGIEKNKNADMSRLNERLQREKLGLHTGLSGDKLSAEERRNQLSSQLMSDNQGAIERQQAQRLGLAQSVTGDTLNAQTDRQRLQAQLLGDQQNARERLTGDTMQASDNRLRMQNQIMSDQQGAVERQQAQRLGIYGQMTGDQLGFKERREDVQPDTNFYASLLQNAANGPGGGTGGTGGTGGGAGGALNPNDVVGTRYNKTGFNFSPGSQPGNIGTKTPVLRTEVMKDINATGQVPSWFTKYPGAQLGNPTNPNKQFMQQQQQVQYQPAAAPGTTPSTNLPSVGANPTTNMTPSGVANRGEPQPQMGGMHITPPPGGQQPQMGGGMYITPPGGLLSHNINSQKGMLANSPPYPVEGGWLPQQNKNKYAAFMAM